MDFSEVELLTDEWDDQPKVLASGTVLLIREVKKALKGLDFKFFESLEKAQAELPGIAEESWSYYFTIFHNSEEFGLPHGKGWLDELSWTIQFLTQMRYIKRMIEIDSKIQASKSTGSASDSIAPNSFQ